ncbi:MAG: hypothetical protein IJS01_06065 [Lentisphaeria bacterium]|nr:hypothetical protein [Lentisphaeria bacterium]
MTGLLIFIGIPLLFGVMSMQSPFFQNWRFLLVLSFSVYLSLWTTIAHETVRPFLTGEFSPYASAICIGGTAMICYLILFKIAANLSSHCGEGYHLPGRKSLFVPAAGVLSGLVMSGMIGYLLCISPLHAGIANDASFSEKAVNRLQCLTVIVDRLTFQKVSASTRRSRLMARVRALPASGTAAQPAEKKDAPTSPGTAK